MSAFFSRVESPKLPSKLPEAPLQTDCRLQVPEAPMAPQEPLAARLPWLALAGARWPSAA